MVAAGARPELEDDPPPAFAEETAPDADDFAEETAPEAEDPAELAAYNGLSITYKSMDT